MKHRSRGPRGHNNRRHNRPHRDRDDRREGQGGGGNFQNRGNGVQDNRPSNRPIIQSVLPSPEILQEYEYASEGTVARLLEMAEIEQDRRNQWENDYLRFHKKSLRMGQLFGFILLASVVWGTIYLGSIGQVELGKILAVSGFFSVSAAALFNEVGRRLSRRPRRR